MGQRGRAPSPTNVRLLHGETRPSRVNRNEPQPREEHPDPPDWLTKEARQVWDRTVAELDHMGLLHAADTDSLVCYVNAVTTYARAQKMLDLGGVMIERDGKAVRNPAHIVVLQNAVLINRFAREFGLTPSSRTGIQVEAAEIQSSREIARKYLSR
jgi:P27 family predicted phage terminase small subunit